MITVQFPSPDFQMRKKGGKAYIFDSIRKTWLLLTEEEWVRQNMVAYFVSTMRYPKEIIALEKGLTVNGLRKRFDILLYDSSHLPWMLVECKAPGINLSDEVLQQVLRYNLTMPVRWLVITNGEQTVVWKKQAGHLVMVQAFPSWNE
jgi:predicted type IV restriction endonuclease